MSKIQESKIQQVETERGRYLFKLEQVLADKNISKNQLVRDTITDFKSVQKLCRGDLVRIDIYVVARICDYLNCDPWDIVEYQRAEKSDVTND